MVDRLFLLHDDHPGSQGARNLGQFGIEGVFRVPKHILDVTEPSVYLVNLVPSQFAILVHTVQVGVERLGDLPNLRQDLFTVGEDDENIFLHFFVGSRVNDRLRNLGLIHIKVPSQRSPQDTFESPDAIPRNYTSNVSNVHGEERLLAMGIAVLRPSSLILDIIEERGLVVVEGSPDLLGLAMRLKTMTTSVGTIYITQSSNIPGQKIRQLP